LAAQRVVTSIDIAVPVEAAWREITKTGAIQRACFDTILVADLRPGAPYRYTSADGKRTLFRGTILEVDPPRRFAITFRFPGDKGPEAKVVYELEAIPGGVRVTIVHEGVDPQSKDGRRNAGGWTTFLGNLRAVLEKGKPSLGTRIQYFLFRNLVLPFMPKDPKQEPTGGGAAG
jgi:uncharacterized protein YndB with AHSA1/START domain